MNCDRGGYKAHFVEPKFAQLRLAFQETYFVLYVIQNLKG